MNACQVEEEADKKCICDIINSDISTIVVSVCVCVCYLHTTKSWENLIQLCYMGKAELRKTNIIFHLNSPFKYRERDTVCL